MSESIFCFNRLNGFHGQMRKSQCYCGSRSIENGSLLKNEIKKQLSLDLEIESQWKGEFEHVISLHSSLEF